MLDNTRGFQGAHLRLIFWLFSQLKFNYFVFTHKIRVYQNPILNNLVLRNSVTKAYPSPNVS